MNDFFITTHIISCDKSKEIGRSLRSHPELSLSDLEIPTSLTEIQKLNLILEEAISEKDDAILIISNTDFLKNYKSDIFLGAIFMLVEKDLHTLILDGRFDEIPICITDDLFLIEKLENIGSFVLLANTFKFIKRMIAESTAYNKEVIKITDILNLYNIKKGLSSKLCDTKKATIRERLRKSTFDKNKNRINIIVPFRNVEKYIEDCYESILSQNHSNLRVFFVDDCSNDNSLKKIPLHEKFIVIKNSERKYALQNIHEVLVSNNFHPEDIIAILDGDDALMDNYSLDVVDKHYRGSNLMTYGSFGITKTFTPPHNFCYSIEEFKDVRKAPWKASHLKTFKYKVYKELLSQDPELSAFKDLKGQFYKMTYDIALMLPMMEICGYDSVAFNPSPIYFYRLHENNDHMINRTLQEKIDLEIRTKAKFKETQLSYLGLFNKN